jgi:glycosyltransferase involved in cell wall biosynthesis
VIPTAHVSVVIPTKDDVRVLECVASVLACRDEVGSLQVIVVDNGSQADVRERVQSAVSSDVTFCVLPEPGVYAARNLGIDRANGDVVFLTDADCVVRTGWLAAGLRMLALDADIVQGYSGSIGQGCTQRLLQARYEKRFLRTAEGDPTECDTRNVAVRRSVFERLRFNDQFRRVGDTEFGLLAEAQGFRVAYAPSMRVDHAHDPDLALFVAKQVCHGWGAQRLVHAHPEVRWHGGHLRAVARASARISRNGRQGWLAAMCSVPALLGARALQRCSRWLPYRVGFWWLTALDKLAALAGHLSYAPGAAEPSPSAILGRRLPRD